MASVITSLLQASDQGQPAEEEGETVEEYVMRRWVLGGGAGVGRRSGR